MMLLSGVHSLRAFIEILIILLLLFLHLQNLDDWGIAHQRTQLLPFFNFVENQLELIVFKRILRQDQLFTHID